VIDAPQVHPVAPDGIRIVAAKLNEWRDGMAEIDPGRFQDGDLQAFAHTLNGKMAAGYLMVDVPMANEIVALAVDPAHRRQGFGRMCCLDALFRSGKRPLVLTANDACVPFAKAVGFKIVGKRKQPDGAVLTRMGWHAPRPSADPDKPAGC
jgi:ribosomal protein S18 acetylase RimI-like enzyme